MKLQINKLIFIYFPPLFFSLTMFVFFIFFKVSRNLFFFFFFFVS